MRQRVLTVLVFAAFTAAALAPLRSYDFFWHLATGRWIVEHRALPDVDPFAVASDRVPWINGEWLFEVVLYATHAVVGTNAMSVLRALFAAGLFVLVWKLAGGGDAALLLSCAGFAGALRTLDVRPSALAALFVVLAIVLARSTIAHAVLTILWINIHPSALLAPLIAVVVRRNVTLPLVSALALLVNPYGWRAIAAPLHLMRFVGSGEFVNAEWLPSSPLQFPLLYVAILGSAVALRPLLRDGAGRAAALRNVILLAAFAYLAVSSVRHQALFFAVFPLLVAPVMPAIRRDVALVASALVIAFVALTTEHALGPQPSRFPIHSVARLKALNLKGNVYNPDQFGGYLIWSFYPERRTLTDGRNELHATFIREYARARLDQRAWRALLRKYEIDLAVDEYRAPLPVLDYATKKQTLMPASLAYWPRREWALIAYDEVSMVFARRAAFGRLEEIRGVVPDDFSSRARAD